MRRSSSSSSSSSRSSSSTSSSVLVHVLGHAQLVWLPAREALLRGDELAVPLEVLRARPNQEPVVALGLEAVHDLVKVHRRVPNATYRAALLDTHNGLGTVSHQLHIFSEGVPSDFAAMVAPPLPPVALHLDGNDFTAWDCLGKADVLITSGSGTFSVNAGFYAADETAVLFLPDVNGSLHDMRHLVAAALPNHILLAPNGTLTRHARRVLRQRKAKSPRIHGMSYE